MQHTGCSALPGVLPSEGLGIGHPFALGAQDLFGDVPSATVAAAQVAHIEAGVTYLGGGIGTENGTYTVTAEDSKGSRTGASRDSRGCHRPYRAPPQA